MLLHINYLYFMQIITYFCIKISYLYAETA